MASLSSWKQHSVCCITWADVLFVPGKAKALIIGAGGLGLWALGLSRAMFPAGTVIYMADIEASLLSARDN